MSATLFTGGRAFVDGALVRADVRVDGGIFTAVGDALPRGAADEIVDVTGLVLSPGFVDLHVHLREPGFSQKETIAAGTRAAAAGGFTTICSMPNLTPAPDSLETLRSQLELIEQGACVEVVPYGTLTRDRAGQALADYAALAPHVAGFSDDGSGVQSETLMREAMRQIAALEGTAAGGMIAAHCEDASRLVPGGCVHDGAAARRFGVAGIPSDSEYLQVARDLTLVEAAHVRYHVCHVSAKETVFLLRAAKARGLPVTAECTPHQLLLCEDDILEDDGRFKMNPPLRAAEDREAIVAALLDGTIDCIATDHAPHTADEKARGLSGSAFGVIGLETAFAACYTALVASGRCSLALLLERLTAAPARVLRREAALRPGAPANLAVLDPGATWQVDPTRFLTRGRATPFAGRTLQGRVVSTWYRGRKV